MEIRGLSTKKIEKISKIKNEDKMILDFRLNSYELFKKLENPNFGPKFKIEFDNVIYYKTSENTLTDNWNNISCDVRDEFSNLGVIDSEKYMDGMGVQYESEVIYHNMIDELRKKNVIFTSIEDALKNYPEICEKYFGKIVPPSDNKYAALNSCVFSGGSFIYIPPNTTLDRPLQSYFRISRKDMGQFERTLIIVDDNSSLHYIEGCTAPTYSTESLHAAVVEIYVGKRSKCRYTTIQNWAPNVNNLVTKRAIVEEDGEMEWIDGNIGSNINMKYPACILKGDRSKGTCITISVATNKQQQDTGSRMIHIGKNTKSTIISKSIAKNGGNATYRGKVDIKKCAINSESFVQCDTLILDDISKSDTLPTNIVSNDSSFLEHEATVSRVKKENLFYLMSRGLSEEKATELIVLGFIEKFREELPMEYAVELNGLLKKNL